MTSIDPEAEEIPKRHFTVRFPPDAHRLLTHLAIERGLSLGDLVVSVMIEWAQKQPETPRYGTIEQPKISKRGPKKKTE